MTRRAWFAAGAATMWLMAPAGIDAQLATRVTDVQDGMVRFAFETRPGVEICDQGIRMGEHRVWRGRGNRDDDRSCRVGLAEVEVELAGGVVRDVEVMRARDDRAASAVDLGEVSAREAAAFLLSLPYGGATDKGAEEAIFPAMLADTDVSEELLRIAQDGSVDESVRKSTLFWLGQEAADAATDGLAEVARDEDEDQEIRNAAVFALSQRPDNEAVPVLIEVARSARHAETRRTAMFWLAQSKDERVVEFFEEILLRRIR